MVVWQAVGAVAEIAHNVSPAYLVPGDPHHVAVEVGDDPDRASNDADLSLGTGAAEFGRAMSSGRATARIVRFPGPKDLPDRRMPMRLRRESQPRFATGVPGSAGRKWSGL
jgi:hypothetical protein